MWAKVRKKFVTKTKSFHPNVYWFLIGTACDYTEVPFAISNKVGSEGDFGLKGVKQDFVTLKKMIRASNKKSFRSNVVFHSVIIDDLEQEGKHYVITRLEKLFKVVA